MEHNPYAPPSTIVADIDTSPELVRPRTATVGVRIFWVMTILGLVGGIFSTFTEEIPPGLPRGAVIGIALLFLLALYAVLFWVLSATGKGRNWGRVTLTVLMSLGMIALLALAVLAPGDLLVVTTQNVIVSLQFLIELVAMVLLYTPSSNAWYAAKRAAAP